MRTSLSKKRREKTAKSTWAAAISRTLSLSKADNPLETPPGRAQAGWVALPPKMAWISWAMARCLITADPVYRPIRSTSPGKFRSAGPASPIIRSGAASR